MPKHRAPTRQELEAGTTRYTNGHDDGLPPASCFILADLADKPVPSQQWLVPDWIPWQELTLLTGDGATGKSYIALQLMMAAATGNPWLGFDIAKPTGSIGLFREDKRDVLHRRAASIAEAMGLTWPMLSDVMVHPFDGQRLKLWAPDASGKPGPTKYYNWFRNTLIDRNVHLAVIDASANVFHGNENDRCEVEDFCTELAGLAQYIDGAVILLAHPSIVGLRNGRGSSGSTHWVNSVRSHLYLTRRSQKKTDEDDDDDDDTEREDQRVLRHMKVNYGRRQAALSLCWDSGAWCHYVRRTRTMVEKIDKDTHAKTVFLRLLHKLYALNEPVSSSKHAGNYAPKVFAQRADREKVSERAFERAMLTCLNIDHTIEDEDYKRDGHAHERLRPVGSITETDEPTGPDGIPPG